MAKQLAFYFDSSICTNCKACQIACQDKNDLPASIRWRRVVQYGGGNWVSQSNVMVPNNIFTYSLSVACMHCEEPICVQVCPTAALAKRDDGLVLIDQSKCIGCRYCEWACPYGAPHFNETTGVMTKCTFCEDLLAQGEQPACVSSCVMRALDFGELDELRAKYGNVSAVAPLPESNLTKPAYVLTPHKNAQNCGSGAGRILNLPEEV